MAVLDTPIEIDDKPGAVDAGRLQGAVRFENVRFSYDGKTPVLTDVSFACEPGQMVALVGPTGVGKTTLTQLLPRFYEPDDGVVSIDGRNIQEYTLSSLRANIAPRPRGRQYRFRQPLGNGRTGCGRGQSRPDP